MNQDERFRGEEMKVEENFKGWGRNSKYQSTYSRKSFANQGDCRWLSAWNCWEKEWGNQLSRAELLEDGNSLQSLEWLFPVSLNEICWVLVKKYSFLSMLSQMSSYLIQDQWLWSLGKSWMSSVWTFSAPTGFGRFS